MLERIFLPFCGSNSLFRLRMKHLSGVAIGATVSLDILFSGPLTGASMNPARSLGPAIVTGHYKGLWIYIIGPTLGAIFGAWTYNLMRLKNKSWGEAVKEISHSQKAIKMSSKDKVICNCGEGWSCVVSKTEEAEYKTTAIYAPQKMMDFCIP
ncbi:hypothetical protein KY290_029094 [Solanum tuberosum]|uniref:Uncharacterized protein n=1 Tax=Solanum tuberosum TaxID=4113 RepID=A0ABQ7UJU2_SOLTU|nr:hypothetical protein KY290_029094 [Solanum tuberosum]